jgi:dihydrofolate reductase
MFRLIAAVDRKLGIAKQGFQPWYIPDDEQYFTDQTKSHGGNVLVGSTTYKTFGGKPLEGRQNYVLTHDKTPIEGANLIHDLKQFYEDFEHIDVWVIGGANVFSQVMQDGRADELYLTQIEADFKCNQFFPGLGQDYQLSEQSELHEQNGFIFRYVVYKKVSP